MTRASSDVWEVMSTARTIRRFTDEPVDDATLRRCLEAATWAPSGANAQAWRFIVLRSPEQRAVVARRRPTPWRRSSRSIVPRRPLAEAVNLDHWDQPANGLLAAGRYRSTG